MKELKSIVHEYNRLNPETAALATVIRVHGSSYRSPGARMLITPDGNWVGSISGGCLEGDALRQARSVMSSGQAWTVTYDTREESNQNLGIGLGCNGVIEVFIEPLVDGSKLRTITCFEKIIKANQPVAMATLVGCPDHHHIPLGGKFVIDENGFQSDGSLLSEIDTLIKLDLRSLFEAGKSMIRTYPTAHGLLTFFVEFIQPHPSLIIFGGGFDARPLTKLAKSMGWYVEVTDECVAHVAPVFFPHADRVALCERKFIERDFCITSYTACVLMSHNYAYDKDVLGKMINSDAPYIGILGPRKRFDKMVGELKQQGVSISGADPRIHSPIGLDIGAETPDEIALSIVAEIQGKFSNRTGGFLKDRNGPIHPRTGESDQVHKYTFE